MYKIRFRHENQIDKRIAILKAYFKKGDAGDMDLLNLFTDDVEIFVPKFGYRYGKTAIKQFVAGLSRALKSIQHYPDEYHYYSSGDTIIVEGRETGILKDGTAFPVKGRTDGRFVSVFTFKGDKIAKMHIYMDPDFAGRDRLRFYWDKV